MRCTDRVSIGCTGTISNLDLGGAKSHYYDDLPAKHPRKDLGYSIMPARIISNIAALICYYLPSGALVGVAKHCASIA
jgi:hypothetical protein